MEERCGFGRQSRVRIFTKHGLFGTLDGRLQHVAIAQATASADDTPIEVDNVVNR